MLDPFALRAASRPFTRCR